MVTVSLTRIQHAAFYIAFVLYKFVAARPLIIFDKVQSTAFGLSLEVHDKVTNTLKLRHIALVIFRTVARKYSTRGLYVCARGLDILKF